MTEMKFCLPGPSSGLTSFLIHEHGATPIEKSLVRNLLKSAKFAPVCVVLIPGDTDIAVYCFSRHEFKTLTKDRDKRHRRWLKMDRDLVEEMSGFPVI